MRLYGEIIPELQRGDYRPYMLCHTWSMISSADLAHYGVSRAKDWISVNCGTRKAIKRFSMKSLNILKIIT